ncbi:N-formylglutamate amidohydrolase [Sphingomonas sp.]|jgi:N-formylglutamate amidohydrolase|uniref:N-formylglutamate amidohydrolase n=1 Tax=Sphingomonas sp. TaxID=28214 RepID=UPI002D7F51FB|nr:N-formylglutamate amidohydrolase [Sphingomonas sp.]HEU0043467.1 N-formylglutamate amidohydrolase [Sphingomonas sp.]
MDRNATAGFECWGSDPPASPVVISVPHAGREYPLPLRAALRVPLSAVTALEDRHVDAVAHAARTGETMLIQRRARGWIDLNRGEDERDPKADEGAPPAPSGASPTAGKVGSGLGLIPRRVSPVGDLWKRRWSDVEVRARIDGDHRSYHRALAEALFAARTRWGIAVLLDLHSMPPLTGAAKGTRIVVGDRFGRAAGARFVARAEAVAAAHGLTTALNSPYAGGHILDRHGRPAQGVHALQLELDRSLYLDRALDRPGPGLERTARMVREMLGALTDEALAGGCAVAAE